MKKSYEIPYGSSTTLFTLPGELPTEIIAPRVVPAAADPVAEVVRALHSPCGNPPYGGTPNGSGAEPIAAQLRRLAAVDATVAVAVNDKTRPVPHGHLLPPLVAYLEELGFRKEKIVFVIATGAHPVMTVDEYPSILPAEILRNHRVECHDSHDPARLVSLGSTIRGTPAFFNRTYAEADVRVVVGNIEPHQFMGYSGGVKSAAIGLAGTQTINVNHARMLNPAARLGSYSDNPARADVEELGRILGIHFALNAVLNDHKQIVNAFAGDPVAVMEAGIPLVRENFEVSIPVPFDLVIVSPGGHPKDINLYQAQKALAHASIITRDGGTIILAASCPEGSGSGSYEKWVHDRHSNQEVVDQFRAEGFRVGPHKAFQIARDALKARVILVSDMADEIVRGFLLEPAGSVEEAFEMATGHSDKPLSIGIMPYANATIPRLSGA
ncbi:MAG TPA: nickel-dependent lactate racemase [Spirochaetia bacterium]|nr:nickel-dependent lactate racemase [Spirochaetia bacterium]